MRIAGTVRHVYIATEMFLTLSARVLMVSLALAGHCARAGDILFITSGEDTADAQFVDEVSQQLQRLDGNERIAALSASGFRSGYALARRDDDEVDTNATRVRGRLRADSALASPPASRLAAARAADAYALIVEHSASLLLIAVGPEALRAAVEADASAALLAVLLSREQLDDVAAAWLHGVRHRRLIAVVTDQPPERQLALAQLALPRAARFGAVYTPDAEMPMQRLLDAGARARLQLTTERVTAASELKASLDRVIAGSDALLALSDPVSTAPGVGQVLLQAALRARLPVVAGTESFVRGGALVGVFTTRQQFAQQTVEAILRLRLGTAANGVEIEDPRYFSVRINSAVAQGLGLSLPGESSLEAELAHRR